ncbi:MAG: hypothetical protein M1822_000770 [Bathelium mastoideum]|nr:MAG: hypothetical protein M1822_000770 [Bathelium mastoideum]
MPQLLGEVLLLTLFADVHYFFSPPIARPLHHRFEKGSYVYLYYNAAQRRGRIEIANNAGTNEQDAFAGSLDNVQIRYSYRHPTLFTIVVDPTGRSSYSSPSTPDPNSTRQWHLPAPDPHNEGHYVFKLNEIDIYFWTMEDASTFLDAAKRVLPDHQFRIRDSPTPAAEHRDMMSPVVQKLEQVAITKPFQGKRSDSLSTNQSSVPPSMTPGTTASSPPNDSQQTFVPMAYNPAAPAAPEPIAHREKTPPPVDGEGGTGLVAAAMNDQAQMHATHQWANPYAQAHPQIQQPGYFSGQPQRQPSSGSMPPPPPLNGNGSPHHLQRAGTFPQPPPSHTSTSQISTPQGYPYAPSSIASPPPPPPSDPSANPAYSQYGLPARQTSQTSQSSYTSSGYNPTQHYSPNPQQQQHQQQSPQPPYSPYPPQSTPNLSLPHYAQSQPPPPPQPSSTAGIPLGGYSQYAYDTQAGQEIQPDHAYMVHAQAYRPTEAEAGAQAQARLAQPGPPSQGMAGRVDRVEKGVGRFLKKLDKKL